MLRVAFTLMILMPAATFAQTEFGVKGGLNVSDIVMTNYIDPDAESDLGLKLGLHAGVFVKGPANESIGLCAELLYSDKGVNANGNIHLHYITLPLIIQYKLGDHFFAGIGPEPGYLFSVVSKYGNAGSTYNNKFDLALDAGFRYDTPKIFFDLRYCVGLFSVREPLERYGGSGVEKIKYQNRALQVSIGYKLWAIEMKSGR